MVIEETSNTNVAIRRSPIDHLRSYQKRDYRDVLARCERVRRVLYVAFMGSGKTVLAAALIRTWLTRGERVLIVTHTREILRQTDDKLRAAGIDADQIGWVWRRHPRTNPDAPIQLASLDTLVRREFPVGITRLVIDEAHHAPAKKWRRVIDAYPEARLLGLTGTPARFDSQPLGDVFDEMIESEPTETLIEQGWIAQPSYWTPEWQVALSRRAGRDFTDSDAAEMMAHPSVLKSMVAEYIQHASSLPALGFAATREKATEYAKLFSASGIASDTIFGSDADLKRQGSLARLRANKLRVLWTCGVLSEGWDYQGLRCVLLARPTLSLARYLQQVARCMRPGAPPVILDLWGAWSVFDPPWIDFGWDLRTKPPKAKHAGVRHSDGSVSWTPPVEVDGQLVRADAVSVLPCTTCGEPATRTSAFNARTRGTKPYCAKHTGGPSAQKEPLPCAVCKAPATRTSSSNARRRGGKAYCADHSGAPHKKPLLPCAVCGAPSTRSSSISARSREGRAYCSKHTGGKQNAKAPAPRKETQTQPLLPCAVCAEPATRSSSASARYKGGRAYCADHSRGALRRKAALPCSVCGHPATRGSSASARSKGSKPYCADHSPSKKKPPLPCAICGEPATPGSSAAARSKNSNAYCSEHARANRAPPTRNLTGGKPLPCAVCGKPSRISSSRSARHYGTKPYCEEHKGGPSAKLPPVFCAICGKPATYNSASAARKHGSAPYCIDHVRGPHARKPLLPCAVCRKPATPISSIGARAKGTKAYCAEHRGGPNVKRPRLPCAVCGKPATATSSLHAPFNGTEPYCSAHEIA